MADALDVPRAHVRVVAGHKARRKIVEIDGLDGETVAERLAGSH